MKPYSDNIIFFDTEFSSNEPNKGEILSLAMLKLSGEELYLEIEHRGEISEWVKEHIVPTLTQQKISKDIATERIKNFIGNTKPYLVTFVNQFDFVYLFKILNYSDALVESTPVDFASILFGLGIDPRDYKGKHNFKLQRSLGVDPKMYHIHNALDDVKMLRDVYIKLYDKLQSAYSMDIAHVFGC